MEIDNVTDNAHQRDLFRAIKPITDHHLDVVTELRPLSAGGGGTLPP
ncbi:MAG TPA: hypothetical protein VH374_19145 [Polyangia bacterium]|jgi:hypothetical protein|nr:hypothetical protein [Polyangia bacterium]